ncbi:zf-HC2 domain-containing protein [Fibrobacterota bacterium]
MASKIMLNCKETSELLSDSMDGSLSRWTRMKLRLHLMMCYMCVRFKDQLLFLQKAISSLADQLDDVPGNQSDSMSEDAKRRIKERLAGMENSGP